MSLIGNYSLLNKSFERPIGGTVAAGNRSSWNNTGQLRNWGKQTGLDWSLTALPQGFGAGGAWMLPKTAGGMTSRREARLGLSATGTGAEGYGIAGTAAISLDAAGIGGLIAGGVGSANISINGVGSVTATIGTTGSATLSLSGSANIGALGWVVGQSQITVSGTLTPYARGHMVGSTAESGLSNTGIANSVWAKVIEAGFSAEQIMRLLAAHAAGAATGLEGSNPQFVGLDGTTTRIDGSYAAGTRTIDSLNGD